MNFAASFLLNRTEKQCLGEGQCSAVTICLVFNTVHQTPADTFKCAYYACLHSSLDLQHLPLNLESKSHTAKFKLLGSSPQSLKCSTLFFFLFLNPLQFEYRIRLLFMMPGVFIYFCFCLRQF